MSNKQLLNKQNVLMKWNSNLKTELVINIQTKQIEQCSTTNKSSNQTAYSCFSENALKQLVGFKFNKKEYVIINPQSYFNLSVDMNKISLSDNNKLLGGGCVSSNDQNKRNKRQNNKGVNSQKQLTELNNLDEICTTEDFFIEVTKERSIDLQGEIFPFLSKVIKSQSLDESIVKILLKIFMYCLESTLLEIKNSYVVEAKQVLISNQNQNNFDNLKKYIKKFEALFNQNKEKYPLESHLIVLQWLNKALKLDNKEKIQLATTCTDSDCLVFSIKFDNQDKNALQFKEPPSSDDINFIDNYSTLFEQKNPIFHLIAYRRIIQQNYVSCVNNLPNQIDQILFAHHKSLNRFKSKLSFHARYYSFFTINQLILTLKDLVKNQNLQQQQQQSVYTNTFLFSKSEGIIQSCLDEFKLQQNQYNDESISTFLSNHQQFRYIASEILKSCHLAITKYLPQNPFYEQQQQYVTELIKVRQNVEKSETVKIIFTQNILTSSPTSQDGDNILKI